MKSKSKSSSIAIAIKAALLTAPALVHAQDAQRTEVLEEIVVYGRAATLRPDDQTTATGLRMLLIDTPQAISVITEEMLQAIGGRSAYDAVDLIPGVNQTGQGFGTEGVLIRAQQAGPRINSIDANAVNFVDSFLLGRVEVVRGPATVLYGVTGAFGGEINQIFKAPQDELQASFGLQLGDFDKERYEADVSGPIPGTDGRLKARVVAAYSDYGLPQDTIVDTKNTDKAFLGSFTYDFTSNTSASIYLYRQDRDIDPTDGCTLAQDADNRLFIPPIPLKRWYCGDPKQMRSLLKSDFGFASLSHTLSNDWQIEGKVAQAKTKRELDYVFSFGPAGAFGLADDEVYLYSYDDEQDFDVLTSTVTLGGSFDLMDRTHQFFAALEYQDTESVRTNFQSFGLGFLRLEDGGRGILADGTPIPLAPANPNLVGDRISDSRELKGSFQVLLRPLDRLEVLAGLLVQRTDLTSKNIRVGRPPREANLKQTDTVGRFGATYGVVEEGGGLLTNAKIYFSYSEGFRPNLGIFGADGSPLTDPQDMKSYEVGLKTEWNDGNVGASLAVYDAELTNVPTNLFGQVGESGGTFFQTLDGKRNYRGVESELVGEILPGWNAALSYTYTKTEVISGLISERLAVANVPLHQASLYTSYEFLDGPLDGFTVGAGVLRKVNSPLVDNVGVIFSEGYDPDNQVLTSVTRLDFRISYKGFTGAFEGLEVFASVFNATDQKYYYSISGHPGFTNTIGRPRTYTFGIRYRL